MATSAATLIQRCRRFLNDWPENDALTASVTSNATQITVADTSFYQANTLLQIDTEGFGVISAASGTLLNVRRGVRGTTAASHNSGATILVKPRYLDQMYLDALNAGINATFPWLYQPVVDESLTTDSTTYEYTIPLLNGTPIPYISKLYFKESSDLAFREFRGWTVNMGSTPKIKLRRPLSTGTLRVYGFGPLPTLSSLTDTLSTLFPVNAEDALTMFAAQYLLGAGEASRVREDTGVRDTKENANTVGSSLNASNAIYNRFVQRIMASGMPPMPKHVINTV